MSNPFDDLGLFEVETRGCVILHRRTEECEKELFSAVLRRPGVRMVYAVSVFAPNNWKPDERSYWAVMVTTDNRRDWGRTYWIPRLTRQRDMGRLENVRPFDPENFRHLLDPDSVIS